MNESDAAYVCDETDGKARMKAWLDGLPPPLAKFYQGLKRMDPKGSKRMRIDLADYVLVAIGDGRVDFEQPVSLQRIRIYCSENEQRELASLLCREVRISVEIREVTTKILQSPAQRVGGSRA